MTNIATKLSDMLEIEAKAYSELYSLLQEERDALVQWSVGELRDIVERKEDLLDSIHELEVSRDEYVKKVRNALKSSGLDVLETKEKLNLTDIISMIRRQDTEELLQLQSQLIQLIEDVTNTNQRNQVLLKRSYEMVNANLDIFTQSEKLAKAYTARGEYKPIKEKHIIDGAI